MLTSLLYFTVGLVLVLTLRRSARRWFGAGPAFTLWLLPALPWLPAVPAGWALSAPITVSPTAQAIAARTMVTASASYWPGLLWLVGVALCLSRLAAHYFRLLRDSRQLPVAMAHAMRAELGKLDPDRLRLHAAGPEVLWALRSRVLLPADFLQRFDRAERQLVLQHEAAHLQRGDALWSLLTELAVAALWFHPLVWLARPRLRLDQELACDERVLRQCPREEARYAQTLLHSTGLDVRTVLIPWFDEPQLKERLDMIQRHRPGTLRRRIGWVGMIGVMLAGAWVAQAAAPRTTNRPASSDPSHEDRTPPPSYPADAVANKQEGTVMLMVRVGPDGKPLEANVAPGAQATPSMVKAATNAVMQWHFSPRIKNGKPVEGYVRVPVRFSLSPLPAAPPPPPPLAPPPPPPMAPMSPMLPAPPPAPMAPRAPLEASPPPVPPAPPSQPAPMRLPPPPVPPVPPTPPRT